MKMKDLLKSRFTKGALLAALITGLTAFATSLFPELAAFLGQ